MSMRHRVPLCEQSGRRSILFADVFYGLTQANQYGSVQIEHGVARPELESCRAFCVLNAHVAAPSRAKNVHKINPDSRSRKGAAFFVEQSRANTEAKKSRCLVRRRFNSRAPHPRILRAHRHIALDVLEIRTTGKNQNHPHWRASARPARRGSANCFGRSRLTYGLFKRGEGRNRAMRKRPLGMSQPGGRRRFQK